MDICLVYLVFIYKISVIEIVSVETIRHSSVSFCQLNECRYSLLFVPQVIQRHAKFSDF
jgi:hypothetical protein